jgi:hypothetical protein
MTMLPSDALAAIVPLIAEFERLGIAYYVGGSIAGSLHGKPRATLDVDIVADVASEHVGPLVDALKSIYYIDASMIREAIARRSCFNLIHWATSFKVDVFVIKNRPYDREALKRIEERSICSGNVTAQLLLAAPEDIVLAKLEWYRLGDEVSEQQWRDVLSVLQMQSKRLDRAYLEKWAAELGVADLLAKAWKEVETE